jgi:hypothetical protein
MSLIKYERVLQLTQSSWLVKLPTGYHSSYTILREKLSKEEIEPKYNLLCSLEKESEIAIEICKIFYDKSLDKWFEDRNKLINKIVNEQVKKGYLID